MSDVTIFVCFVSTGEYSDRTEWSLHGYFSEDEAKGFVSRSDELHRKLWVDGGAEDDYEKREELFQLGWNPEAPNLDCPDYTGFRFWYEPVVVKGAP